MSAAAIPQARRLPTRAAASFKAVRKFFVQPPPLSTPSAPARTDLGTIKRTGACVETNHEVRRKPSLGAQGLTKECEDAYRQLLVSALLQPKPKHTDESVGHWEGKNGNGHEPTKEVSDQEWEIRTGRAIYILQQTLPDFFSTGLVSTLDVAEPGAAASTSQTPLSSKPSWSLPGAAWLGLADKSTNGKGKGKANVDPDETEGIYSPRIRLTYKPPTPLPAPFPDTLHIEGLHLYIASSIFLRHTLNALNTDLRIELRHLRVQGGQERGSSSPPPVPRATPGRVSREKSVSIGLRVAGTGRVSGAPVEWQVNCTYVFSPVTGHILHHIVDSIEPAPQDALFQMLGKFGLLGGGGNDGGLGRPGGVTP